MRRLSERNFFLKRCEKRCELALKGMICQYRGIFTRKPMQIMYILVALKLADYLVQIKIYLGVKKGVKLPKIGVQSPI